MNAIYAAPTSRVRRFAEAIAWLWRLGPVRDRPDESSIAIGWEDEVVELRRLLGDGGLAGAALFTTRPGPRDEPLPSRHRRFGMPTIGSAGRVAGEFILLEGLGEPVVSSELGAHAIRDERWIVLGADPETSWGAYDAAWSLVALADFLADVLDRPLVMLPPLGCARLDDLPGDGYHQVAGNAKSDARQLRRVRRLTDLFAAAGGRMNLAIPPRTLVDGREAPVDELWPKTVAAIRGGVEAGCLEPIHHGYLHLDTDEWAQGRLSPREFEHVGREETERRVDTALAWSAETFGEARRTFVAPTWAYGEHLHDVLAARDIPAWVPARVGPLVDGNIARETVCSTMEGLAGLDYRPLGALAAAGLPPTVTAHGGLFDARLHGLLDWRQGVTTARLFGRRDLYRAPWSPDVRWIGATELVDRLRAHGRVAFDGSGPVGPSGTEVVLRDRDGARTVTLS